jgi:hypothetical protein
MKGVRSLRPTAFPRFNLLCLCLGLLLVIACGSKDEEGGRWAPQRRPWRWRVRGGGH